MAATGEPEVRCAYCDSRQAPMWVTAGFRLMCEVCKDAERAKPLAPQPYVVPMVAPDPPPQ